MNIPEKIILNPNATHSRRAIEFFRRSGINFIETKDESELETVLSDMPMTEDSSRIIICGGDGTINVFLNEFMKIDRESRKNVNLGILPCGRANDLVRATSTPLNIAQAYSHLKERDGKPVDLLKVNDRYFITGGGIGLAARVIETLNDSPLNKRFLNRVAKDLVYYAFTLKNLIQGYKGVRVSGFDKSPYLVVSVQNQPFIGKRFNLAPEAVNDDGLCEICFVPGSESNLRNIQMVRKIIKGAHLQEEGVLERRVERYRLATEDECYFMGDGELLCKGREFNIEVMGGEVNLIY
jgi:diacylglycerol kinase (ATP)